MTSPWDHLTGPRRVSWSACTSSPSSRTSGLYRDDGLGACRKTPFQMEKIKKQIQKVFRDNGLNVIISVNLNTVDFLDVTLDLKLGTYKPFSKPNMEGV